MYNAVIEKTQSPILVVKDHCLPILGKKKTTYVYKTADELIAKGAKRKVKDSGKAKQSRVKVIDMTGKEQRVLSGKLYYSKIVFVEI